jgi:hypothetical protein
MQRIYDLLCVEERERKVAPVSIVCNINAFRIIIRRRCYTETAEKSPMDCSPPHSPQAVTLPSPT